MKANYIFVIKDKEAAERIENALAAKTTAAGRMIFCVFAAAVCIAAIKKYHDAERIGTVL